MTGPRAGARDDGGGAAGHVPVLVQEVLAYLKPRPGGVYVDATIGAGGHAEAILERIAPDARDDPGGGAGAMTRPGVVIGIDRDADALAIAGQRLARYAAALILRHANFTAIRTVVAEAGFEAVDGIVMDLGVSSLQLDAPDRGFSFSRPGPLDMRMDRTQSLRAADLVNGLSERELGEIIFKYGEERWARRIARAIVRRRPLDTTDALAGVISGAIPRRAWPHGIHAATHTFQALRIAVNAELDALEQAIPQAVGALRGGGSLCVITFHSLDDRILKHTYLRLSRDCVCLPGSPTCTCGRRRLVRILTRKPVTPSIDEVRANPRARSAKMRAAERLDSDPDALGVGHPYSRSTLPSFPPDNPPPAPGPRRVRFHSAPPIQGARAVA